MCNFQPKDNKTLADEVLPNYLGNPSYKNA
jgi:hypothetical protein